MCWPSLAFIMIPSGLVLQRLRICMGPDRVCCFQAGYACCYGGLSIPHRGMAFPKGYLYGTSPSLSSTLIPSGLFCRDCVSSRVGDIPHRGGGYLYGTSPSLSSTLIPSGLFCRDCVNAKYAILLSGIPWGYSLLGERGITPVSPLLSLSHRASFCRNCVFCIHARYPYQEEGIPIRKRVLGRGYQSQEEGIPIRRGICINAKKTGAFAPVLLYPLAGEGIVCPVLHDVAHRDVGHHPRHPCGGVPPEEEPNLHRGV